LQPRLVVLERAARELRPFDGVLAFFDPLLRRAATIVKLDHILRVLIQIGHNEADTWEQFACVSFDLGHDAPCPLSRFRLILEAVVENVVRCQVNPSSVHLQFLPLHEAGKHGGPTPGNEEAATGCLGPYRRRESSLRTHFDGRKISRKVSLCR
jgi:hypothetical protein